MKMFGPRRADALQAKEKEKLQQQNTESYLIIFP